LLDSVLHGDDSFSEDSIADFMDRIKTETVMCADEMITVLRRFEGVNNSLHKFVEFLRSNDTAEQNMPRSTIQRFQDIIPWNYIPKLITDIVELATPRGKSSQNSRSPKECLNFALQLSEPLRRVIEAWGVLLRQVILVSRLLTGYDDFICDTMVEEVKELHDFFACLQEAALDFVNYVPKRLKRQDSEF